MSDTDFPSDYSEVTDLVYLRRRQEHLEDLVRRRNREWEVIRRRIEELETVKTIHVPVADPQRFLEALIKVCRGDDCPICHDRVLELVRAIEERM